VKGGGKGKRVGKNTAGENFSIWKQQASIWFSRAEGMGTERKFGVYEGGRVFLRKREGKAAGHGI